MRNRKKRIALSAMLVLLILLIVVIIGVKLWNRSNADKKLVFTTGLGAEELFRIDELSCSKAEFMVYLTNTQNQYENVYGAEIWQVSQDGVTLEENIKDTVLAKIAQIKSMYLLAKEKGVELSEEEELLLEQAAEAYITTLTEEEQEILGISREVVLGLYREYAYAERVYEKIIADVNPEISDDEARTITVEQILIKTYTTDASGKRLPFTEEQRQAAYAKAQEVSDLAKNGENDFSRLAEEYSEDAVIRRSFGKGETQECLEAAAFLLGTEQISDIVETEEGYVIIKCISTFDREETDANKVKIVEKRKNEAFGAEYDAFVAKLGRRLNEKLWESISLPDTTEVKTDSFFLIYHQYMG